jgi:hypothetical protein
VDLYPEIEFGVLSNLGPYLPRAVISKGGQQFLYTVFLPGLPKARNAE